MKKTILVFMIFLVTGSLSAQSFSVFNVDASGFPTVKAKFWAFDASGNFWCRRCDEEKICFNENLFSGFDAIKVLFRIFSTVH